MSFEGGVDFSAEQMEGKELSEVFFEMRKTKSGTEFRSSAPDRKIIILSDSSRKPIEGMPCRIRVIQDTDPTDPLKGKLIAEIIDDTDPVRETENSVTFLGIKLEKAENKDSILVPRRENYENYIDDKEISMPLQRDIATAWFSGEPILVEGGTSLGKTTTVRRMAALLGWQVHYINLNGATDVQDLMGRYVPNPNKNKPEDPEYIFADGPVSSALRQEEGVIKILVLDEFNAAPPNVSLRLHEVLDELEHDGNVVLAEDASEIISVSRGKTKAAALTNTPGKGYFQREPIDPAQLRRWVYKKMPDNMPKSTFEFSTDALFGLVSKSQETDQEMFLSARKTALTMDQLRAIPGIENLLQKYKEFHEAAKEMVKNRQLAQDQPQLFTYDDRTEPRRVRDFVLRFYNGDMNETFQAALRYYYSNKLETRDDKNKLEELIRLVEYTPPTTTTKKKPL